MSIYISGSVAYDRIMTFQGKFQDHILPEKLHVLNISFMVNRLEEKRGGTAGNIAYSLALLGEKPLILAAVGRDFGGYADALKRLGLPMDGILQVHDELTAGAYITTDLSSNQITGFHPAAMGTPCGYDFKNADVKNDIAVVSPGNLDDMRSLPRLYKEKGIRYIYDPGQQIPVLSGQELWEAICGAYALIVNDYELDMIMKSTGRSKGEIMSEVTWMLVTYGADGSAVFGPEESIIPAVPAARVVDPTGAGDAYRAGVVKGILGGLSMPFAACLGSTCASFCVEQSGTQEHFFDQKTLMARYEASFGPLGRDL